MTGELVYELIYSSVASTSFSDTDLLSLLDQARANNRRLGVTGMLIYDGGEFLQLLEGDKDRVEGLYDHISRDSRHRSLQLFYTGEVSERSFDDWSMGFKMLGFDDKCKLMPGFEPMFDKFSIRNLSRGDISAGKKLFVALRNLM